MSPSDGTPPPSAGTAAAAAAATRATAATSLVVARPRERGASSPVARVLVLLVQLLCALVAVRFFLILIGANVDHPIVAALLSLTDAFSTPFEGMFPQPADDAGVLPIDLGAIIGICVLEGLALVLHAVGQRTRDLP